MALYDFPCLQGTDIWEGYDVTSVHALGQEQIAPLNILALYSGWVKKKNAASHFCVMNLTLLMM